jgi:hypothetical protein
VIGGNVYLDLLSLFPQRYARIMWGIERWASFPRSTMEGERESGKRADQGRRRGGVFIPPPIKMVITTFQAGLSSQNWTKYPRGGADYPARTGQKIRPPSGWCAQKSLAKIRAWRNCNSDSVFDDLGLIGITTMRSTTSSIETS